MIRRSRFTLADQKPESLPPVTRWRLRLGWAMLVCRSKAAVLAARCCSLGSRAKLDVNVSAMWNCMVQLVWGHFIEGKDVANIN